MKLQEMRKARGYSQAELAQLSGINLRSLQDYEQGHKRIIHAKGETLYRLSQVLGYSVEDILKGSDLLLNLEENDEKRIAQRVLAYENAMKKRRESMIHFPVVVSDHSIDMSRIYPTKQRLVKKVADQLRPEKSLEKLVLFGSSITMRCHKDSDLDFCVGLSDCTVDNKNRISEMIQDACDWGADILWWDRICSEDRVYDSVMKGVVLI